MKPTCVRSAAPGRRSVRHGAIAALAVVAASTSGCYTYLPAQVEPSPPVGEDVRLVVTRDGAVDFAEVVDLTNAAAPRIDGKLERAEQGSLMIRVPLPASEFQPGAFSDVGQLIRVPNDQILGIERREFDPVMSGIVVGGIVTGATLLLLRIIDAGGVDNPRDNPDPVLQIRLPLGLGIGR